MLALINSKPISSEEKFHTLEMDEITDTKKIQEILFHHVADKSKLVPKLLKSKATLGKKKKHNRKDNTKEEISKRREEMSKRREEDRRGQKRGEEGRREVRQLIITY